MANEARRRLLQAVVADNQTLMVHTALGRYPAVAEMQRLIRVADPQVVLVDLAHPHEAVDFVNEVAGQWPRVGLVGVDPPEGVNLDALGFGGYVSLPPEQAELTEAVSWAVRRASGEGHPNLFSFLPAKAGCGCSTVVEQTALELARMGKRVLVLECDLRSGVMSLMLKAQPAGSMQSALAAIRAQEGHRTAQNLTTLHGVDFLLSSRTRMERLPQWSDFHGLIEMMAPRYDLVLADLPELVNEATAEVVLRSQNVHLVSTQELLALELAPRRLAELSACGVPEEKVKLVMNRFHRQELSIAEVESHVGRPVAFQLPNDYVAVRRAVLTGAPVVRDSGLGRAFKQLAEALANGGEPAKAGSGWGALMGVLRRVG
jgi:pilus assembly protein CpaE